MSLKKFLRHHLKLLDARSVSVRYLLNFVGFVEILLVPFILSPSYYSVLERDKQLISFVPIVLLGSGLGLLKAHFIQEQINAKSSYLVGVLITGLSLSCILYALDFKLLFIVAAFLYILVSGLEKLLILQNNLIFAASYKAIISLSLILVVSFAWHSNYSLEPSSLYAISVVGGLCIWIVLVYRKIDFSSQDNKTEYFTRLRTYTKLIQSGFLLSVHSSLILLYFITDRYIIGKYFADYLSGYSLAFAFAQIGLVLINTIAYSLQYRFGINNKSIGVKEYNTFKYTIIGIFLLILIFSTPIAYFYGKLNPLYKEFFNIYIIIFISSGLYFSVSATSIMALYLGLSRTAFMSFFFFLALNIFLSPLVGFLQFDPYFFMVKSGLLLVGSAIYLDWKILQRLRLTSS